MAVTASHAAEYERYEVHEALSGEPALDLGLRFETAELGGAVDFAFAYLSSVEIPAARASSARSRSSGCAERAGDRADLQPRPVAQRCARSRAGLGFRPGPGVAAEPVPHAAQADPGAQLLSLKRLCLAETEARLGNLGEAVMSERGIELSDGSSPSWSRMRAARRACPWDEPAERAGVHLTHTGLLERWSRQPDPRCCREPRRARPQPRRTRGQGGGGRRQRGRLGHRDSVGAAPSTRSASGRGLAPRRRRAAGRPARSPRRSTSPIASSTSSTSRCQGPAHRRSPSSSISPTSRRSWPTCSAQASRGPEALPTSRTGSEHGPSLTPLRQGLPELEVAAALETDRPASGAPQRAST